MHKLSPGNGYLYLTRHIAGGDVDRQRGQDAADYYAAEGNPPGRWLGKGIAALGISADDVVTEAQMRNLFGLGMHPDADRMIAEYQQAHVTAGMSTAKLARVIEHAHRSATLGADLAKVAGYDLVLAPVKSAALVWALDARPEVRQAIITAHQQALTSALAMLEDHAAYTRAGKGGLVQVDTNGLVAVAFDHYDSRAGDPNPHTHLVISAKVQRRTDGKWRALDARPLHRLIVAVSEHYNTAYETALTSLLDTRFEARPGSHKREPVREVAGVPTEWIGLFSQRHKALSARFEDLLSAYRVEHDREPGIATAHKLLRQANLETRQGKKAPRTLEAMRQAWRGQLAKVFGTDGQSELDLALSGRPAATTSQLSSMQIDSLAAQVIGAVAERRSVWNRWNVHAETERCLRHGAYRFATIADQKRAADTVVAQAISPAHSVLVTAPALHHEPGNLLRADGESVFTEHAATRYTSTKVLEAERRLLVAAQTPVRQPVPATIIVTALRDFESKTGRRLDAGQLDLVTAFASRPTAVSAGIGAAGTGKTTAMHALRVVVEAAGHRLIPLATSSASAARLGSAVGTTAENLHKFLTEHLDGPHSGALTRDRPVPDSHQHFVVRAGDVILVDEAGMAGTFNLDRLVMIADRHGAVVRLLGDYQQLGSVESGGAFRLICHDTGAIELDTVHRFHDPAEAAANLKLRAGNPDGLGFYFAQQRVSAGSRQAMVEAAYVAWRADMLAGKVSLLIASTNRDVAALNQRARADRVGGGHVEAEGVELHDGTLAGHGDWIVTRHNDRRNSLFGGRDWVKNGDLWTVLERRENGDLLARHHSHGGQTVLPAAYVAEHVELGYATTTHRAQGATVDTAHLVADASLSRENLYVGATRATAANQLYVVTHESAPLDDEQRVDSRRFNPHARTGRDVLEAVLHRAAGPISATETIRVDQNQAASLATIAPRFFYAAEQESTARYTAALDDVFGPDQARRITSGFGWSLLNRALQHGELAGADPRQLIAEAAENSEWVNADAPALSLVQHVLASPLGSDEQSAGMPSWLALPVADDQYLHQMRDLIAARIQALIDDAIMRQPAWMTGIGSAPTDPELLVEWRSQLGIVAAYRDQYQVTTDKVDEPLGPTPEPTGAGHSAYRLAYKAFVAAEHLGQLSGPPASPAPELLLEPPLQPNPAGGIQPPW